MFRLSIIVPVYNVDKYLSKCLDSLLQQDIELDDYEIIIVNDGSIDDSLTIAKTYQAKYSNIQILSKVNAGLGAARNTGITAAIGKYMFFVDSDDYIQPNSLRALLSIIETKKLDALRFNFQNVDEAGQILQKKKNATYNTYYSEQVIDGETFLSEQLGWACYVWAFLFDTSFLKKNQFLFNESIYFEDVDWLVRVLLKVKRIQSIDKIIYYYLQRAGSITKSTQIEKKNKIIDDKLYITNMLKSIAMTTNKPNLRLWCEGLISLTFMGMLAFVQNELMERKNELILYIKQMNLFPFRSYRFTLKQRRDLMIMNFNPRLYCYLRRK